MTVGGLRIDLSGSLESPGHAIQAWYACDPDLSAAEIERHLQGPRIIARETGLDLAMFFAERDRLWPRIMRWEACYFVLWSKQSLLNREERKHPCSRAQGHFDWLVNWCSDPTDVVCDPFMGSGTTGVACIKLGRPFIGIEIKPRWFDLACERIDQAQRQGDLLVPRRKEPALARLI